MTADSYQLTQHFAMSDMLTEEESFDDCERICSTTNSNILMTATVESAPVTVRVHDEEPSQKTDGRVQYDVTPQWASNAIQLTGSSVEISLEQLRNLYQDSLDPATWDNKNSSAQDLSQIISISLTPNFTGT